MACSCDGCKLDRTRAEAEVERLAAENSTLRNAQKACETCDAPTMAEVAEIRAEVERLTREQNDLREEWAAAVERGGRWKTEAAEARRLLEREVKRD